MPAGQHPLIVVGLLTLSFFARADAQDSGYDPKIAGPSREGELGIASFRLPEGVKAELFAAEPLLANPVAFSIDEHGRIYVCETFRHSIAATDNREHMNWLDDDLAARSVEDRVAMFRKYLPAEELERYTVDHDRVRLLVDEDGDGKADRATVFADGFNGLADGIGAGVLARGGDVWYACIPSLWKLRDTNGDGKADEREALHTGYGVHVSFLGHDLHGLTMGPDGLIYFSIGDRGLNVQTREGTNLLNLDSGAILRCEPDGSHLEIVANGLRNPQELAFDEFGNLFTGENNSDGGDQARVVWVVPGGDYGWRIGYQYLEKPILRGPWHSEHLWHLHETSIQPKYIVPPVGHLANGPSGICYNPGVTALPDRFAGSFFLSDFKGNKGVSGVHSFRVRPKGAGFELAEHGHFIWGVAVTDVDFGPDGAFYLSDWVEGWKKPNKGRIYKFADPAKAADPRVAEVRRLIAEGFGERPTPELVGLLAHADLRIRREAQFALAKRGEEGLRALVGVATASGKALPRIHAIWGIGQVARAGKPQEGAVLIPLLADSDAEVRAQAAKVLGEIRLEGAADGLIRLLKDEAPRARLFAAIALGRLDLPRAIEPLAAFLAENADRDPYLRHAGVMGLSGPRSIGEIGKVAGHSSASVRLAAALALRRNASPKLASLLGDREPLVAAEVARGLYDAQVPGGMEALAAAEPATSGETLEPVLRRIVWACARVGGAEQAGRLAKLLAAEGTPELIREEALAALRDWDQPIGRDPVTGLWRPAPARSREVAAAALAPRARALLAGADDDILPMAIEAAAKLGLREAAPELRRWAVEGPKRIKIAALRALDSLADPELGSAVVKAARDKDAAVRGEALGLLAKLDRGQALAVAAEVLADDGSPTPMRQAAAKSLGVIPGEASVRLLVAGLDRLIAGEFPADAQLELLDAARARDSEVVRGRLDAFEKGRAGAGPIAPYRECIQGGDAEKGRALVRSNTSLACLRCHVVEGEGGEVGPHLDAIGSKQTPEYLLESIVAPAAKVAEGFETLVLSLSDGRVVSGVLKKDDGKTISLATAEGKLVEVDKADVEEQARGGSAMPEDLLKFLTKEELRDIIAYLSNRK
jgi:quinoprotein glucose dehydrogenase